MEEKLTFQEFTTFLMLYASYEDMEYEENEEKKIISTVGKEIYDKVFDFYHSLSDYKKLETIMDYKKLYYPTKTEKKEMLSVMEKQFEVDGNYSTLEKALITFLDKLL